MRCGSESEQCIRIADICNAVKNCLNGWDETAEQCVDETQRNMFVVEGKKESLQKFLVIFSTALDLRLLI